MHFDIYPYHLWNHPIGKRVAMARALESFLRFTTMINHYNNHSRTQYLGNIALSLPRALLFVLHFSQQYLQ